MTLIPELNKDKVEVNYTIEVLPEDTEIEGNASAIDEDTDAKIIKEIREQLESGNEWAWCTVKVTAHIDDLPLTGVAYLGCCSYRSQEDFENDAYYKAMRDDAKADLLSSIKRVVDINKNLV